MTEQAPFRYTLLVDDDDDDEYLSICLSVCEGILEESGKRGPYNPASLRRGLRYDDCLATTRVFQGDYGYLSTATLTLISLALALRQPPLLASNSLLALRHYLRTPNAVISSICLSLHPTQLFSFICTFRRPKVLSYVLPYVRRTIVHPSRNPSKRLIVHPIIHPHVGMWK